MIDGDMMLKLPPISRAREYHLYDGKGGRILDMYQLGGRALCGHRPLGLSHRMKNSISRGVWGGLPNEYPRKLRAVLGGILPSHPQVVLLPDTREADRFLSERYGVEFQELIDPAMQEVTPTEPTLWRPLCPAHYEEAPAIIPVLPFPGGFAPIVVCLSQTQPPPDRHQLNLWDSSCSPILLDTLIHSVSLIGRLNELHTEVAWSRFDPYSEGIWKRKGPYLAYLGAPNTYPALFKRAFENGVLLHPGTGGPSIIPASYSDGEVAPLFRIMLEYRDTDGS